MIADFNGDGKPDFAVADAAQEELFVFLNTTPARSSTASFLVFTFQDANTPGVIAAVTLNGVGNLPDIVVANVSDGTLTVFMNGTTRGSGSPVFTSQTVSLGYTSTSTVSDKIGTGDFNGDGSPDLAISSVNGPLVVLINSTAADATTASFGTPLVLSLGPDTGDTEGDLAVGDVNDDGEDDIAYVAEGAGSLLRTRSTSC